MLDRRTDEVNPLTAAGVERWDVDVLFLTWLLARSTGDLLDGVLAAVGLSADEYAVFSVLAATGGTTPTELSRWTVAPSTTMSACVKRLTARGLVVRVPNPEDGRSSLIRLTPAGEQAHAAARQSFGPVRSHVVARLGEDHQVVVAALTTLRAVVDSART